MGTRKTDPDALPSVAEAMAEGGPQAFPDIKPAGIMLPEAGVSFVQYQGPKDKKTNRQPKAVRAIVVGVEGSVCTLKLLDRKNSPRVEGVPYSATRTDDARWFWA